MDGVVDRGRLPLKDQYRRVGEYLAPVSNVILSLIVLGYLDRVVAFRRRGAH